MQKKLLFVINVDWFFVSHRLQIALEAIRCGYEVHIATGITDKSNQLQKYGLIVHPLSIDRGKTGLAREIKTFIQIGLIIKAVKPDLVHLVTVKPVTFGGIAARFMGVPAVVAAVSGLGFVFISQDWKASFRRILVKYMYRLALGKRNLKVIFQNSNDRDMLAKLANLNLKKTEIIRGSGVNLEQYQPRPLQINEPVVVLAARLLVDKGVREFVDAARILKKQGLPIRFWLVGTTDPFNPSSITEQELESWRKEQIVELKGFQEDIARIFSNAHIVVLPSYREGLPKVLIEAAACGRAVITTNVPGCRDAIEPGVTGLLIPAHNSIALANSIATLISNTELCKRMGLAGRAFAEREFDIREVVKTHLNIYKQLLDASA